MKTYFEILKGVFMKNHNKLLQLLFLGTSLLSLKIYADTFTVTNTNDSGAGSLRQAIIDSNASSATLPNQIDFNITTGTAPFIISVEPPGLPTISKPVIIDGYSQPGASKATSTTAAILNIVLDGKLAGIASGLILGAGSNGSTIQGLVISNFDSTDTTGIFIDFSSGNKIFGNYIGTDQTGTGSAHNFIGIVLVSANNNSILQNIISSNDGDGVLIENGSSNNTISCNKITENGSFGVQVVGSTSIGNAILGDSIFNNAKSGIGLTSGGNNQQPAPVITCATTSCCTIKVSGTLSNSTPNTLYAIDFFVNTADRGVITEGATWVGRTEVTTDSSGSAQFSLVRIFTSVPVGQFVSATATPLTGPANTSEFSSNLALTQGLQESTLSVAVFSKYCARQQTICAELGLTDASTANTCKIGCQTCLCQNGSCPNCCLTGVCQLGGSCGSCPNGICPLT